MALDINRRRSSIQYNCGILDTGLTGKGFRMRLNTQPLKKWRPSEAPTQRLPIVALAPRGLTGPQSSMPDTKNRRGFHRQSEDISPAGFRVHFRFRYCAIVELQHFDRESFKLFDPARILQSPELQL
jgi:hypothetical protein